MVVMVVVVLVRRRRRCGSVRVMSDDGLTWTFTGFATTNKRPSMDVFWKRLLHRTGTAAARIQGRIYNREVNNKNGIIATDQTEASARI